MATYSVGSWHGIAAKTAIALLPPNVPLSAIEQIWRDLHENGGLAALLDGLGEVFGTRLTALPEFAIVSELADPGSLSVAVRGPIEAKVSLADGSGPIVVTGVSVTPWSEQVLSGVTAVELSVPGAANHDLRPVRDGVVPTDRISMAIGPVAGVGKVIQSGQTLVGEPADGPPGGAVEPAAMPTLDSVPEAPVERWLSAPSAAVMEQRSTSQPVADTRPGLAVKAPPGSRPPVQLVLPGAANVILDRTTIIGRQPRLNRVPGGQVPQLVTVPSPGGGVSSNHIELRIEGVSVLAVDLDSTNGSRLLRRGRQPVRLAPGEETLLVSGDQLDLGEGVLVSFEGLA